MLITNLKLDARGCPSLSQVKVFFIAERGRKLSWAHCSIASSPSMTLTFFANPIIGIPAWGMMVRKSRTMLIKKNVKSDNIKV